MLANSTLESSLLIKYPQKTIITVTIKMHEGILAVVQVVQCGRVEVL